MRYIERGEWGAIKTGKRLKDFWRPVRGIIIHHTTGPSDGPWKRVRAHDRYHVESRGWDSIAYNWLVSGETGEIFEGRGWKRGAATRGWNSKSISVAYIGDSDDGLTERGKESILTAVGAARERYGDHLWVKCHKDFSPTTCPGTTLTQWIDAGMVSEQPHTNKIIDWGAILRYITDAGLAYVTKYPIKRRSTGKWVAITQQKLNDRIDADLKVDGIYGKKSVAACKRFQSQFAMKVNGTVDAHTWKVLWTV